MYFLSMKNPPEGDKSSYRGDAPCSRRLVPFANRRHNVVAEILVQKSALEDIKKRSLLNAP